jgi:hypothetical protein
MTNCQKCRAKTQLNLCNTCTRQLHEMLTALATGQWVTGAEGKTASGRRWYIEHITPGLLEHLADAANGQTRLGISVRKSTDHTTPLPYNDKASALLAEATDTLQYWCETVSLGAETLGVEENSCSNTP